MLSSVTVVPSPHRVLEALWQNTLHASLRLCKFGFVCCIAKAVGRLSGMKSGAWGTEVKHVCAACGVRKRSRLPFATPRIRQEKFKPFTTRATNDKPDDEQPPAEKTDKKKSSKSSKGIDALNPIKLGRKSRAVLNDLLAVAESAEKGKQTRSETTSKGDVAGTDAVNPIKLGRKSRAVLDDLWEQFASITSPTRSAPAIALDDKYRAGEGLTDFETPQAAFTTVLVIGATGKVGRVLVRKLLLRGYTVRALVRPTEDGVEERPPGIPQSVQLVFGDIGDYASCREAAQGADKVSLHICITHCCLKSHQLPKPACTST